MDSSATLRMTDKGADEVAHRTFKLGIKLRSVLLLLNSPQTIQSTLKKSVFPEKEIQEAIEALVQQGFIAIEDTSTTAQTAPLSSVLAEPPPLTAAIATPAQTVAAQPTPLNAAPGNKGWSLDPEIILSEAKFLLIDFCVDCFGMQAEKLTDDLRACRNVEALNALLKELIGMVNRQKPDQLSVLRETVRTINETA